MQNALKIIFHEDFRWMVRASTKFDEQDNFFLKKAENLGKVLQKAHIRSLFQQHNNINLQIHNILISTLLAILLREFFVLG